MSLHSRSWSQETPWENIQTLGHLDKEVEQATAKVSCSKTLFSVNSVYTNDVLNARVHV